MIINEYDKIVNKFNTLKEINFEIENIYSNIAYQTTKITFEYNEIIEEKDKIILEDIQNNYSNHLVIYDDIATNILNITFEYEKLIIERDLLYERARVEDGIIDIREVIIDPIIYNNLKERILNIVEVYNENIEKYIILSEKIQELSIIYNSVITRTQPNLYNDGPIISIEKYNYLENLKAEKTRIALLKEIKKQKKIKLALKPREGSFLFNNKKKFYNKFSILKDKTRMYEIFGNFNIVVFEKISLGIAECIHLNQPTIFYYPKNLYKQKNKKYNELLYLLKKANIYFDDKKKMLQFLKSKKNISLWWDNKNNLKNRKKFLKEFANSFEYSDLSKLKKLV